jgi:hypothetical protein
MSRGDVFSEAVYRLRRGDDIANNLLVFSAALEHLSAARISQSWQLQQHGAVHVQFTQHTVDMSCGQHSQVSLGIARFCDGASDSGRNLRKSSRADPIQQVFLAVHVVVERCVANSEGIC